MKDLLAVLLVGLNPKEYHMVMLLMYLQKSEQYGEIPGSNLRNLMGTNVTKEQLFLELEKLVQKNILRFSNNKVPNTVYISAGKGYYVFNQYYQEWVPTSDSGFYKVARILGYTYNKQSYNTILRDTDFREELVKDLVRAGDSKLTPYEAYDIFCNLYKRTFNREYGGVNQIKDFQTLKKLIYDMSFENYSDNHIKDFLEWSFRAKSRDFKGDFIVGFLPLCLQDYRAQVQVQKIKPGYTLDENGRLKIKDEDK